MSFLFHWWDMFSRSLEGTLSNALSKTACLETKSIPSLAIDILLHGRVLHIFSCVPLFTQKRLRPFTSKTKCGFQTTRLMFINTWRSFQIVLEFKTKCTSLLLAIGLSTCFLFPFSKKKYPFSSPVGFHRFPPQTEYPRQSFT